MLPARPGVLWKMATPRRFVSRRYGRSIVGEIYGGDFRRDPDTALEHFRHIKWQSSLGYYLQIAAATGWTSIHWLHRLRQPTLIMAGRDDPLIPLPNARLMNRLIPNSELRLFDCGHLFLLTRTEESAQVIRTFLDRPAP
jgi:pimeloyl-ACP methyl ester carboxylesterase